MLIFMNVLYIVSRTSRWGFFNYLRVSINFLIGIGLALMPLIYLNPDYANAFEGTPWILPTLCLTFFFILIFNHLPHPPPWFFNRRKERTAREGSGLLSTHQRRSSADGEAFLAVPGTTASASLSSGRGHAQPIIAGYRSEPGQYQNLYVVYEPDATSPHS